MYIHALSYRKDYVSENIVLKTTLLPTKNFEPQKSIVFHGRMMIRKLFRSMFYTELVLPNPTQFLHTYSIVLNICSFELSIVSISFWSTV